MCLLVPFNFYPRPVLAFGYCHRLRLWVCVSVCVYQSRACPHDNSSPIQARITKFGPEMQNTLVWVPIVFGNDRPWSSRSNLTWKSNFTPFWACSHHYSSAIQARITSWSFDSLNVFCESCLVEFLREAGSFYLIWCNLLTSTSPRRGQYHDETWVIV